MTFQKIDHIGIVVKDLAAGVATFERNFGLAADATRGGEMPAMGLKNAFIPVADSGEADIEFIQPLGEASPIAKFVERNADGGIHHVCYEVVDIIASRDQLIKEGARVLGDGQPKIGAHGKPVLFFHPKDFSGALVEIEQA